ncbi:sphingosine kinase, partial [bacterium]
IVAGGGDGTLNTIASALVGGDVPFAVLPLGTFNHLAKELEIPLELEAAVEAICNGRDVPFNVGKVNDRHFLLFAAIGVYSEMIKHRDAQRKALGRKKMWAGTIAALKVIFRWPLKHVKLRLGDAEVVSRHTPFVYVSLSGYQMDSMGLADAPKDARAKLNVVLALEAKRFGLVKLMARALVRHVRARRDVGLIRTESVELAIRGHRHVRVGYDGEVESMELPLRFELVRGGLRMRVPQNASKYVEVVPTAETPQATLEPA